MFPEWVLNPEAFLSGAHFLVIWIEKSMLSMGKSGNVVLYTSVYFVTGRRNDLFFPAK